MNRTATRLATLLVAGLAIACTDPGAEPLSPDGGFEAAASLSQGVYVLNTQLRGIIDPDIEPSPAWGHIQIKLTDDADGFFSVAWNGKLFNPAGQTFTGGGIVNPDAIPGTGSGELVSFFDDSAPSCDVMTLDSEGITDEVHIAADIAIAMIIDPEVHEVLLETTDGANVSGTFGVPDPTTVLGWNPQPDPPGKMVRCDAVSE